MQQERTHSGASAKRQKRLVQGITIGGFRSAYVSIKRGPAHANLKRVLAACPLRAMSGRSITTHCANCFSPPFVIFTKRQALLARFRSPQIRGFKSRTSKHRTRHSLIVAV